MSGEASPPLASGASSLPPTSAFGGVAGAIEPGTPRLLVPLARALAFMNRVMVVLGMLALLLAAAVLTSSVLSRYFLQGLDRLAGRGGGVLLVGATFLAGAYVQSIRGHVGIEALTSVLPARANAWRHVAVDLICLAFCAFFAWKSWTLLHDAWVDGQTTKSTWASAAVDSLLPDGGRHDAAGTAAARAARRQRAAACACAWSVR